MIGGCVHIYIHILVTLMFGSVMVLLGGIRC